MYILYPVSILHTHTLSLSLSLSLSLPLSLSYTYLFTFPWQTQAEHSIDTLNCPTPLVSGPIGYHQPITSSKWTPAQLVFGAFPLSYNYCFLPQLVGILHALNGNESVSREIDPCTRIKISNNSNYYSDDPHGAL